MKMFGRKKKEKNDVKTFVEGEEVESDVVPIPKNPEIAPALEPEQVPVQEPPQSQEEQPTQEVIVVDCLICSQHQKNTDYGFYIDSMGVWHPCPRCNPTVALTPTRIVKDKSTKAKKPKKKKR